MPVTCAALHSVASELHSVAPDLQSVAPICAKLQQIVKQSVIIAPPSPTLSRRPAIRNPHSSRRSAAQEESAMECYLFCYRYLSVTFRRIIKIPNVHAACYLLLPFWPLNRRQPGGERQPGKGATSSVTLSITSSATFVVLSHPLSISLAPPPH